MAPKIPKQISALPFFIPDCSSIPSKATAAGYLCTTMLQSRKLRESKTNINLIISQDSSLSAKRHLNRIPYRSLIEYEPERKQYIIKDGANKGSIHTPQEGDIIANIDKNIDSLSPILKTLQTELIYRHNPSDRSGVIFRVTGIKPSGTVNPPVGDEMPIP